MHLLRENVEKVYDTILAIVGIPVGIVVIITLARGKCGLSTCSTLYLVAMATSDLLFIIFYFILRRFPHYYYPQCFVDITPVCSIIFVLVRVTIDCSVWFTVAFTFDRFVAICFHQMKSQYCTKKTAMRVLATISIFFSLKNIPNYFPFKPGKFISNVPWYYHIRYSYYSDRRWKSFQYFEQFLTPMFPFTFILFLNILTVSHILKAIQVRKGLRAQRKIENDPETESRRNSAILLFALSTNFILLWLAYILYIFDAIYFFDFADFKLFEQVAYMLRNLSCCTNALIYVVTQRNFRDQVKYVVKYPVIKLIQMMNKSM